jgi:copper resistance protein B
VAIKTKSIFVACSALAISCQVWTANAGPAPGIHDTQIFKSFQLDLDYGEGRDAPRGDWDFEAQMGGDYHKLHINSEGEINDSKTESSEIWFLYGRNIATYWDLQVGARQLIEPDEVSQLAIGFEGLAPYFIETTAHLFMSEHGDLSARLVQERDFIFTQKFIITPSLEATIYAQDVSEQDIGSGLANAQIGLQGRYDITRRFSPYAYIRYERKFGDTKSIALEEGERKDDVFVGLGVRAIF